MALEKFRNKLGELWVSERLVGCIAEISENTPLENDDGMRAAVVDTCVQHVVGLTGVLHQGTGASASGNGRSAGGAISCA